MKVRLLTIAAILLSVSSTAAHAGFWSWLFGGGWGGSGGSGGGHSVPEIDAMAGMATFAVIIGVALLVREKFFRK